MTNKCELPTDQLIKKVEKELISLGYGTGIIKRFKIVWDRLLDYVKSITISVFNAKIGMDFLEKTYNITVFKNLTNEDKVRARAINILNDYYLHGMIFPKYISRFTPVLSCHYDILKDFIQYRKQFQISDVTLHAYEKLLGKFLFYLEQICVYNLSKITAQTILNFCDSLACYSSPTIYRSVCILRVFLRFLHEKCIMPNNLVEKVPHVIYRRDAHIPSAFPKSDVQKILDSVDRGNPIGKRDFSILLLASRLGLRSGDIRNMRFSNIHWERNTIELTMVKTGKEIILPLTEEVGMAIIDYVKYGRPQVNTDIVFLRHISPIQKLSAPAMTSIVRQYILLSGIEIKPGQSLGPHAMRHSLASALLEDNIPLPVISEILGHSNSKTTGIYLKIDLKQLKRCALEVPEFNWNIGKEIF